MTLTVDQRDDLLREMLPVATALVCAVRDRDREDVAEALAPLQGDWLRTQAVIVALSALVPEDQSIDDLAAWSHSLRPMDAARFGGKPCSVCQVPQAPERFDKDASHTDGLTSACKDCRGDQRKKRKRPSSGVTPAEASRAAAAKGRASRMAAARERRHRYAELRRGGFSIQECAWELQISNRQATRYEAEYRSQQAQQEAAA